MRAGAALSRLDDPGGAAAEAAERALARAGVSRADAAFVFASGSDAGLLRAAEAAAARLGTPAVVGAAAHGVLAGAEEEEDGPAVAVLALAGVEATPFRLEELAGAEDAAGAELEDAIGRSAREGDLAVLLVDPVAVHLPPLLRALDEALPAGALVGAGAALGGSGPAALWCAGEPLAGGGCGLVLHLPRPARTLVAHGCRPITGDLRVTRSDGHWVLELDGRPALDVFREAAGSTLGADLRRAGERLALALPRPERGGPGSSTGAAGFVVRTVAGFAPERRAFALAEELRPGALLRVALRDADLAREDFTRALAAAGAAPAAALYLSCPGRGQRLFRHAGLEAAYVARALEPAPLAGMFGSFQLAPVAGATELHTYAGVLALLP